MQITRNMKITCIKNYTDIQTHLKIKSHLDYEHCTTWKTGWLHSRHWHTLKRSNSPLHLSTQTVQQFPNTDVKKNNTRNAKQQRMSITAVTAKHNHTVTFVKCVQKQTSTNTESHYVKSNAKRRCKSSILEVRKLQKAEHKYFQIFFKIINIT